MKQKNLRRVIAGASAVTLTAGFAAAFGITTATAAPDSVTWSDGGSNFKRTVSDNNPAIGDTITMTTNFYRSKTPVEYVQAVKDIRHACLTFVSASPSNSLTQGTEPGGEAFSRVAGSWSVYPNIDPKTRAFEFTYRVSENCPIGVPLNSGMHYGGTLGSGEYNNKGPIVTVKKAASTTTATIDPAPQSGRVSTITATVGPDAAAGEVEFFNGDTSLGTATLSDHKATIDWTPTSDDATQDYSITAKYLGDAIRDTSTSTALTGTVAAAPTAPAAPTGLAASANPVTVGDEVTISGHAEAGSNVTVAVGAQECADTADESGAFSCGVTTDTAGDLPVTAIATNGVGPSAPSETLTLTVNAKVLAPAAPSLTVGPATVTAGDEVTVTAVTDAGNTLVVTAGGAEIFNGVSATGTEVLTLVAANAGNLEFTATASNSAGPSPVTVESVTVTEKAVVPATPEVTLAPSAVTVGDTVTATIKTVPNATLSISVNDGAATQIDADASGDASFPFQADKAGTTTVTVTASNSAGTSAPATSTVLVNPVAQGDLGIVINPAAPVEGDDVTVTVTGADANSDVTIKSGDVTVCTTKANAEGIATCTWKPAAGSHELTITTTVNGAEKVQAKPVTVGEPTVDPGGENPGDGGGEGGGNGGSGSLGDLGSLTSIFGSLG